MNPERRYVTSSFEVRARTGGGVTIVGHAPIWNRYSQNLGGFVEQVAPGATTKTIQEADIRGLFNHDPSAILGRNKSGTMRLAEDSVGLAYEIDVPDTSLGRDLALLMERGDLTQSSFSFRTLPDGDEWSLTPDGFPLRTLTEIALYDLGPVTFPAYLDSESGMRSALASLTNPTRSIDDVIAVAGRNELRSLIPGHEAPGPVAATQDPAVARHRCELLARGGFAAA